MAWSKSYVNKGVQETNQLRNYEYDPSKEPSSRLPWFNNKLNITNFVDSRIDSDFHHQLNSPTQIQIKSSRWRVVTNPINSTDDKIKSIGLRPPNTFDFTIDNIPRHVYYRNG